MSEEEKLGWKALPVGGLLLEVGSSMKYKTGDWRTSRPVVDPNKCTNCLICWIYCPDMAVIQGEKVVEINYDYCKGCGICAAECPVKAITMEEE